MNPVTIHIVVGGRDVRHAEKGDWAKLKYPPLCYTFPTGEAAAAFMDGFRLGINYPSGG